MILLQTQLVVVVIDMAVSLDQFGNISLFIVQGKGPIPGANPIMYTTSPTTASQEYSVLQTSDNLSPEIHTYVVVVLKILRVVYPQQASQCGKPASASAVGAFRIAIWNH